MFSRTSSKNVYFVPVQCNSTHVKCMQQTCNPSWRLASNVAIAIRYVSTCILEDSAILILAHRLHPRAKNERNVCKFEPFVTPAWIRPRVRAKK